VSRLWSRFGIRTLSVALLVVALAGGLYLGRDREAQQRDIDAGVAIESHLADEQMLKERAASRVVATSRQRAAKREAAAKAAAAAKKAAQEAKRVNEAATRKKAAESAGAGTGTKKPTVPYTGPIPESCNEYSGNRKIGCALMLERGFELDQFPCLNKLWARESGWNHRARNNSSGAYGIPQALPGGKMASAGDDWESNPATQIKWGLGYIKGRYDTPCGAWQHSEDVGWY
jgi:hypothetical protein